jgi:GNAT superfamily N-acetyltransferase
MLQAPSCRLLRCTGRQYGPRMATDAVADYVAAFLRFRDYRIQPGQIPIDEPGVVGYLGSDAHDDGRLLITDDCAEPFLQSVLPPDHLFAVQVLQSAPSCVARLAGRDDLAREEDHELAMVLADLDRLPPVAGVDGLTIRAVQRVADDPEGVPLETAVAESLKDDPEFPLSPQGLADAIRQIPQAGVFAALDSNGQVQATSAAAWYGTDADVFFVWTHAKWRGRGVGTAMTAHALANARVHGATGARLLATEAGAPIYRRLGFSDLWPVYCFNRAR